MESEIKEGINDEIDKGRKEYRNKGIEGKNKEIEERQNRGSKE